MRWFAADIWRPSCQGAAPSLRRSPSHERSRFFAQLSAKCRGSCTSAGLIGAEYMEMARKWRVNLWPRYWAARQHITSLSNFNEAS